LDRALLALVVCSSLPAAAQPRSPAKSEQPAVSGWAKGNRVLLGVTQSTLGFSAQWRFERSTIGDIYLETQENRAGRMDAGSLLLLSDGALLVRDMRLLPGRELDAINGPLLMLQLVLQLLERGVPGGPKALARDTPVDIAERSQAIKVSGVGAEGEFLPPWHLTGSIGPAGSGRVKFELHFESAVRGRAAARYETDIAGIWQNAAPPVVFQDGMGLRGWQVYQIKPVTVRRGTSNAPGLGTSAPMGFQNLGEVRRRAAQWTTEQARRSRWQCS
jgi:hypothetical protein